MTYVNLINATDSYVSEANPSKNYSNVNKIYLTNNAAADTRQGYLYFGVPSGLAKTTVIQSTLKIWSGEGFDGSVTLTVYRLGAKFSGTAINWNNKPPTTGPSVSVTKSNAPSGTMWEFDVTAMMQNVANGAAWYGFQISSTNGTAKWIHSTQSADANKRPTLMIKWSDAPDAPERMYPPNGSIVSLAKPTLQWDFTDPSGDQTMGGYNIRLFSNLADAVANTNPILDNYINSGIPECNLATDVSYAGMADGGTLRWRVRVKDGQSLWSGWSPVSAVGRISLGALTVSSPPNVALPEVSDHTPTIAWSLTGRTQQKFQVMLHDPDNPAFPLWASGIRTSTDTSLTIPAGYINIPYKTYRVTVQVWDTTERAPIAGDPGYVQVTRDFKYSFSGVVAPVTNFGGTPHSYFPHITLTWARSAAPDTFVIIRDGAVVDEVLPSEVTAGGTAYQYIDTEAAPRKSHTWSVACKYNGATSLGNPTVTAVTKAVAPVLTTMLGTRPIVFLNPEVSAAKAETSDIHNVVGSAPPVLITQNLRGYEGSVQGVLVNGQFPGLTAESQADNLDYYRKNPGMILRFIWADKVIRVVARNFNWTPIPRPDGSTEYLASFEFFQVDF